MRADMEGYRKAAGGPGGKSICDCYICARFMAVIVPLRPLTFCRTQASSPSRFARRSSSHHVRTCSTTSVCIRYCIRRLGGHSLRRPRGATQAAGGILSQIA
jgi:hypothetical protein